MASISKFANANTVVTTGFTNPTNAYADDGVYATAIPAKNSDVITDYGFPAFTTGEIPSGSQIDSVTGEIQFKVSGTGAIITVGVRLNKNGTLLGTEQTNTSEPAADTLLTHQVTTGVVPSDLTTAGQFKVRVRAGNGNSGTAITVSVDYVKLTVVYSDTVTTKTITGKGNILGTTVKTITGVANIKNTVATFMDPGGDATFDTSIFEETIGATVVTDIVHGSHIKSIKVRPGFADTVGSVGSGVACLSQAGNRISFYMYLVALPSGTNGILQILTSSSYVVSLRLTSAGVIQLWNGPNTAQIGTDGATLSTGQWYRISMAYTITSTSVNRFEIFVDGVSSNSITNATVTNVAARDFRLGNADGGGGFDARFSDIYMDDSTLLTDPGNIWVTAKRPNANGTTNGWTTQIGSGGSGYGSGHSQQINERPKDDANGWSTASLSTTEEYAIESVSQGDIDITGKTLVDMAAWFRVSNLSGLPKSGSYIFNGASATLSFPAITDIITKFTGSKTYPSGGSAIGVISGSGAATYRILELGLIVAYIGTSNTVTPQTITGVARIEKAVLQTETGKAAIQKTTTRTESGVARIQKSVTQTIQGLARITASTLRTIQGLAQIRATTTRTESGKARIQKAVTQTIQGLARITAATARTIQGLARITASTTRNITGLAQIRATTTRTETGKARMQKSATQTETGLARIQKAVTATIQGVSRVTAATARTIQGLARITASTTRNITGVARITKTTTQTIQGVASVIAIIAGGVTGRSRIQKAISVTINGLSRITASTLRTIQGLARVTASTARNITGKAAIQNTTTRTETGVARITATKPFYASEGANSPDTAVNDASIGTNAWSNPGNILASDDSRATVVVDTGEKSNYLKATDFDFNIPSDAIIEGIQVEWEKSKTGGGSGARDWAVRIVKGNTIGSTDRSSGADWTGTDAYIAYGGSTDKWGETWAPSDINATDFGAALSCTEVLGNIFTMRIDHVRITVYYRIGNSVITGVSRITAATTRNITGKANIEAAATSQNETGVARIEKSVTRTEQGVSRIQRAVQATIDGLSRIQKVVTVRTTLSTLLSPGTMANDTAEGVMAWLNVDNAKESDNVYSTTTPFTGETETRTSYYLKATNFGFRIPAGATIAGIKAEVERKKNTTSVVIDHRVKIVKADGSFGSENKAGFGVPLWSTSDTYREYGGESDLWSESWTPADINDEDFGFGFSVSVMSDDNSVFASVDHMRITVYYYVDSIFGVARIEKAVSRTITGVADILKTTTRTIDGKARIQKAVAQVITGVARITASTLRTIQGVARITATATRTITGKARIQKLVQQTISGVSRIQKAVTAIITGKTRIQISVVQTETGKARIMRVGTQTETGLARIQKLITAIITGKSRIQVSVGRTVTGKARIQYTTVRTITGKANLVNIAQRTITGKARISITTTKNITGVARIKLARVFPYKPKTTTPYSPKAGPYSNKVSPYSPKVGPYSPKVGPYGDFPPDLNNY